MLFQESESVELKSRVTDDLKKEIIAFANCGGGKLYIGVRDDGTICGVADPDSTALQISNMVRDAIKPDLSMFIHYETMNVSNKQIVTVNVQQGTMRPYYISKKGLRPEGVYVRHGYSSVPATNTVIRKMIKETDGDRYEEMRSQEQNLTFKAARHEFSTRNVAFGASQMKTLGLISQDGVFTNLGLLLSDQCYHTVKVAFFQGTTQDKFKDRNEFSGSLFTQMNEIYLYINLINQTNATFKGLNRIDVTDYPEAAIREALLNLLVHREYSFSSSAFIRIYSDRIEFTSIGGLVTGISPEEIYMGISVCRNEKLANVFFRLSLIEAFGTGIQKILESYSDSGLTPRIETTENAFKITLPNRNYHKDHFADKPEVDHDSQKKIMENPVLTLAKEKEEFTRKDLQEFLNISQTSCIRLLKKMVESGQIIQKGKGKNTCYSLTHPYDIQN